MDHPGARVPGPGTGVLEERDVVARRALLVAVEEVVDRRVVLVDRLLDHPEAQHARVEVHVAGSVAGDGGDVVDAFEIHTNEVTRRGRAESACRGRSRACPARTP